MLHVYEKIERRQMLLDIVLRVESLYSKGIARNPFIQIHNYSSFRI